MLPITLNDDQLASDIIITKQMMLAVTSTTGSQAEAADLLEKAADVLHTKGWIQGRMTSELGRCAVGAIRESCAKDQEEFRLLESAIGTAVRSLASHLDPDWVDSEKGKGPLSVVTQWNDAKVRTQSEVEEALKSTAKDLRNQA